MESKTNKELLEIILHQTKENAKNQLNFAGKVSSFMNNQNIFNSEIKDPKYKLFQLCTIMCSECL